MVDVTKENFEKLYPKIAQSVKEACFIAIDGEFTGLSTSLSYEPTLCDTPSVRYNKLKKSLCQFTLCQIGVAAFLRSGHGDNCYKAHTYNFFLFPQSYGPVDSRFLCQASAMEFLSNHGFHFEQFIKNGVSYMNNDQETILRKYHSSNTVQQHISSFYLRQLDESYINPELKKIEEFVKGNLNDELLVIKTIPPGIAQYVFLKSVEKRYKNISCVIEENGSIEIRKILNLDEKFDFNEQYEKFFHNAVGFKNVTDLIIQCKKPVVGHNLLSDLILVYDKFCGNVPDLYGQFKKNTHKLFPHLYDTKHVAFSMRKEFKDVKFFDTTALEELYKEFSSGDGVHYKLFTPTIEHGDGFNKYKNTMTPHEAGFDAYMTGFVFLRLAHFAASKNIGSMESRPLEFAEHLAAMKPYENCVNIPRAAVRYLNFAADDPPVIPPVQFIVTLKDSKKFISVAQVAQDFLPFGSVDVKLMTSSQVIVSVSHRKRSRDIVKAFARNKYYYVVKYNWWYHSRKAKNIYIFVGASTSFALVASIIYCYYKNN